MPYKVKGKLSRNLKEIEGCMGNEIIEYEFQDNFVEDKDKPLMVTYCWYDVISMHELFEIQEIKYKQYSTYIDLLNYFKVDYIYLNESRTKLVCRCLGIQRALFEHQSNYHYDIVGLNKLPARYQWIYDQIMAHNFEYQEWLESKDEKKKKTIKQFKIDVMVADILLSIGVGGIHGCNKGTYITDKE
jgi:hypothetical protein